MKKHILILSALLISAAVFCGCDETVPVDTSPYSSPGYDRSESSAESSEEKQESSQESQESSAHSSKEQSSRQEKKTDEQELKEYAESLQKEGEMKGEDGAKAVWKVREYKVGDINKDGSPELVIKYDVGPDSSRSEQALALEIVKFDKGDFLSFRSNSEFTDYIKDTGDTYLRHEAADELYIDGSGRLSILSTCLEGEKLDSIVYNTYSIDGSQLIQTENLVVKKEEYIGSEQVDDLVHCVYGIIDEIPVIYRFSVEGAYHTTKLNSNTGLPLHAEMLAIKPLEGYSVPDAMSHSKEANQGYDTTKALIVSIEDAEQAYRNRKPTEEGESAVQEQPVA